jgi:hypothetical protein
LQCRQGIWDVLDNAPVAGCAGRAGSDGHRTRAALSFYLLKLLIALWAPSTWHLQIDDRHDGLSDAGEARHYAACQRR